MNRSALLVIMTALATTACQPTSGSAPVATATALDNNPIEFKLPAGIDAPPPIPRDNPITPAKVELGRQLFFDARLSSDRTVSCANEFTRNEGDRGRFKTPTLREITFTAPYMHDGSEPTLEDVIGYYDRDGNPNPNLDPDIVPLHLTQQEKADLLALLQSFNGEGWKVQAPVQLPPDNDSRK